MSNKQSKFAGLLRQNEGTGENQKEKVLTGIIENEHIHEIKSEHETVHENISEHEQNKSIGSLMGEKVLKEDTHTRQTYMIENTVLADLNKAAIGKKKGFKTEVVNLGIKLVLEEMNKNK